MMKKNSWMTVSGIALVFLVVMIVSKSFPGTSNEPWSEKQLMQPSELANMLSSQDKPPVYIFNIGPSGHIRNAIDIGPAGEEKNLKLLEKEAQNVPKDAQVVLYCGCCPFGNCPNIRPAFKLLNDMKFTNHKLLNLSNNLKTDWIDKGYPMR